MLGVTRSVGATVPVKSLEMPATISSFAISLPEIVRTTYVNDVIVTSPPFVSRIVHTNGPQRERSGTGQIAPPTPAPPAYDTEFGETVSSIRPGPDGGAGGVGEEEPDGAVGEPDEGVEELEFEVEQPRVVATPSIANQLKNFMPVILQVTSHYNRRRLRLVRFFSLTLESGAPHDAPDDGVNARTRGLAFTAEHNPEVIRGAIPYHSSSQKFSGRGQT